MKAIVYQGAGGVEVITHRDDAVEPVLGREDVLVRVKATAVNRADVMQRMGRYPAPPGVAQDIPGLEFAGVIERVGEAASERRPGERVFGLVAGGAYAEYVSVHERVVAVIPEGMDFTTAAAVPEAFITAHDALFAHGHFQVGQTLLVQAVGSGVGIAAVQLAKAVGGFAVGTSRTQAKLDRAREYGCDLTLIDDDAAVDAVIEYTKMRGVDVIFDFLGPSKFNVNLRMIAIGGRIVQIGMMAGVKAEVNFAALTGKRATIVGTTLRNRPLEQKIEAAQAFARGVVPLLGNTLRPVIDSVYPLEAAAEAQARMESNANFGKIVLTLE